MKEDIKGIKDIENIADDTIQMVFCGHRGFGARKVQSQRNPDTQFPENSLISLKKAMEAGADAVEFDVYLSEDNHVMVIHDDELGTNAKYIVQEDNNPKYAEKYAETKLGGRVKIPVDKTRPAVPYFNVRATPKDELQARFDISKGIIVPDNISEEDKRMYITIPVLEEVLDLVVQENTRRSGLYPRVKLNIELKGNGTGQIVGEKIKEYIEQANTEFKIQEEEIYYLSYRPQELSGLAVVFPKANLTLGIPTSIQYKAVDENYTIVDYELNKARLDKYLDELNTELHAIEGRERGVDGVDMSLWDVGDDTIKYFVAERNYPVHVAFTPIGESDLQAFNIQAGLENINKIAKAQNILGNEQFMIVKTDNAPLLKSELTALQEKRKLKQGEKEFGGVFDDVNELQATELQDVIIKKGDINLYEKPSVVGNVQPEIINERQEIKRKIEQREQQRAFTIEKLRDAIKRKTEVNQTEPSSRKERNKQKKEQRKLDRDNKPITERIRVLERGDQLTFEERQEAAKKLGHFKRERTDDYEDKSNTKKRKITPSKREILDALFEIISTSNLPGAKDFSTHNIESDPNNYILKFDDRNTAENFGLLFLDKEIECNVQGQNIVIDTAILEEKYSSVQNHHLKRYGKDMLSQDGQPYNMRQAFAALNVNSELLSRLEKESIIATNVDLKAISAEQGKRAGKIGTVEFIGERHHGEDHADNIKALIGHIGTGDIGKDTVIAIELKNYGKNLGMPDVMLLANIIKHNEQNPDNKLIIPTEITNNSLIYQDALLYNAARDKGVQVVGLEGKGLHTSEDKAKGDYKGSDLYNELRNQHMANVINELTGKGYNVVVHVGSSHVEPLKKLTRQETKVPAIAKNFSGQDKEKLAFIVGTVKPYASRTQTQIGEHRSTRNPKSQSKNTGTDRGVGS